MILAGPIRPATSVRALQALPAKASRYGYLEHVPAASHATLLSSRYNDAIIRGVVRVRDARPVSFAAAAG